MIFRTETIEIHIYFKQYSSYFIENSPSPSPSLWLTSNVLSWYDWLEKNRTCYFHDFLILEINIDRRFSFNIVLNPKCNPKISFIYSYIIFLEIFWGLFSLFFPQLLLAGKMYEQGHGDDSNLARVKDDKKDGKEPLKWTPVSEISKALNSAFYLSFTVSHYFYIFPFVFIIWLV